MRPKSLFLLVLALGCGLIAAVGISQVMERNKDQGPAGETGPVWVAMTEIKYDEQLSMQNLKLEQWPKEKIPPGALTAKEDVDGKRARITLYPGDVVIDKKLIGKDDLSAPHVIPKGYRIITVTANAENANGGLLHPGDRVDLLVYFTKGNGVTATGTKTILQDIRVFAVNEQWRPAENNGSDPIMAKTVSLLVTPEQAEKVSLVAELGKIKLTMRSPDDKDAVETQGTNVSAIFQSTEIADRAAEDMQHNPSNKPNTLAALLNQQQQPAPATQPAPQTQPAATPVADDEGWTVTVIRGNEINEQEFTHKLGDHWNWKPSGVVNDAGSDTSTTPDDKDASKSSAKPDQPKKAADKKEDSKKTGDTASSGHA